MPILYLVWYKYLDDFPVHLQSLNEVMNKDIADNQIIMENPINSNSNSMFEKGFFEKLKILICCFWGKSIASKNERDEIDQKFLKQRFSVNQKCLADVIYYYGIKKKDIKIVSNYEEGIK